MLAFAATAGLVIQASPANGATAAGSPICAQIPDVNFLRGKTSSVVATFPVELPAGRYLVDLSASDGYPGRAATDPNSQQSEQVRAFGITTPDLADGVESANADASGEVEVAAPFASVTITHALSTPGINSVHPVGLCVTPVVTETPTTEPPVLVTPTTVPTPIITQSTITQSVQTPTTETPTVPVTPAPTVDTTPTTQAPAPKAVAPALPATPAAPAVLAAPAYTG